MKASWHKQALLRDHDQAWRDTGSRLLTNKSNLNTDQRRAKSQQLLQAASRVLPKSQESYNRLVARYVRVMTEWGHDPWDETQTFLQLHNQYVVLLCAVERTPNNQESYVMRAQHAAVRLIADEYETRTGRTVTYRTISKVHLFIRGHERFDRPKKQAPATDSTQEEKAYGLSTYTNNVHLQQVLLDVLMTQSGLRVGDVTNGDNGAPIKLGDIRFAPPLMEIAITRHKFGRRTPYDALYVHSTTKPWKSALALMQRYCTQVLGIEPLSPERSGASNPHKRQYLFPRLRNGKPTGRAMSRSDIQRALQDLYDRGGFALASSMTTHSRRRTMMNRLSQRGFQPKEIRIISRHAHDDSVDTYVVDTRGTIRHRAIMAASMNQ